MKPALPIRLMALCVLLALLGVSRPAVAEPGARRVVSINLCTDQLAMLLAAPGQLASITYWAREPHASMMVEEARAYPLNDARAEQVYLLAPDLVLASDFTDPTTLEMLRRLGIRVETFASANSIDDIKRLLRKMGAVLGQEQRAEMVIAGFERDLAALAERAAVLPAQDAAYHYPNNYTAASGTLADEVLALAGLGNAARKLGKQGFTRLDLESLILEKPFLVRSRHIGAQEIGRSFEAAQHPAMKALAVPGRSALLQSRWTVCGLPSVIRAVAALIAARE
ncbi:MAG: ABC transporter substrate-binding protein [Neomegalonema sp.]|nr:ABC transporter substrate-binding protein [Neomegalonema sp.]